MLSGRSCQPPRTANFREAEKQEPCTTARQSKSQNNEGECPRESLPALADYRLAGTLALALQTGFRSVCAVPARPSPRQQPLAEKTPSMTNNRCLLAQSRLVRLSSRLGPNRHRFLFLVLLVEVMRDQPDPTKQ